MRRPHAVLAPCLVLALLAGCAAAPPEFDPATGEGVEGLIDEFAALDADAQLDAVATADEAVQRRLWAGSGLEDELGGADAADEIFAALNAQLGGIVDEAAADPTPFVLASSTDGVSNEARGAGLFAGMLLSAVTADGGIRATEGGATGEVVKDFGGGSEITVSATADGMTSTRYTASTTYKGVRMDFTVVTEISPCPDAAGQVEARGQYQVSLTGPKGSGTSTQLDVTSYIQVNDDAEIASSEFAVEAAYMDRPQGADDVPFDLSTAVTRFEIGRTGDTHVSELSVGGFWKKDFQLEAWKTAIWLGVWVSHHLNEAAKKGWQDGRCIDLKATYSDGPSHLDPDAEVTITATPTAKQDGQPAGGTVTAALTGGTKSVSPSATKVKAPASLTYLAPAKKDETGTVHLESRSKRGVGKLDATLDTKALAAYSIVGGGGDFQGSGTICDITKPFTISGSGVTMNFVPSGADGGTYSYSGAIQGFAVSGGERYEVTSADGVARSIRGYGIGSVETPIGTQSGYGEENYTLTPLEGTPAGC